MFYLNVGKSKCLYSFTEISHFYDLEKPRTFGILNQILQDTGKDLFKTHKTGNRVICTCNRVNTAQENSDSTVPHSRGYTVSCFFGPSDVLAVFWTCLLIEIACGGNVSL